MKKASKKVRKSAVKKLKKKARRRPKIDERLLNLPHSGIGRLSKSLAKIEDLSGMIGRAVLLRAKSIRESLRPQKSSMKKSRQVVKKAK